jgi:hypothetical protein
VLIQFLPTNESKYHDFILTYTTVPHRANVKGKSEKEYTKNKSRIIVLREYRLDPPGRLGSSLIRFPAISLLFNARRAASAALTS